MDQFAFIPLILDQFITIGEAVNMTRVCKSINLNMVSLREKAQVEASNAMYTFHNMMQLNSVRNLEFHPSYFTEAIPMLNRLVSTNIVFQTFIRNILTGCKHAGTTPEGGVIICHICQSSLEMYECNITQTNMFTYMSPVHSFITSVAMHLYH